MRLARAGNSLRVEQGNRTRVAGSRGASYPSKWATIAKVSPDTALREIGDLVGRGILNKDFGGGRSTIYSLAETDGR